MRITVNYFRRAKLQSAAPSEVNIICCYRNLIIINIIIIICRLLLNDCVNQANSRF